MYEGRLSGEPIKGSLNDFLDECVGRFPDHIALSEGERRITYFELSEMAGRFASALHEAGIRKGDRLGLMLPNCPEYAISFFGEMRTGAAATQVNPVYVGRELTRIFENSGSETVVVHAAMYSKVKDIQENTPLERIICVGQPKGESPTATRSSMISSPSPRG